MLRDAAPSPTRRRPERSATTTTATSKTLALWMMVCAASAARSVASVAPERIDYVQSLDEILGSYSDSAPAAPNAAAAATSARSPSATALPEISDSEPEDEEQGTQEDYKQKEEWWKDPLSMFDDDDEGGGGGDGDQGQEGTGQAKFAEPPTLQQIPQEDAAVEPPEAVAEAAGASTAPEIPVAPLTPSKPKTRPSFAFLKRQSTTATAANTVPKEVRSVVSTGSAGLPLLALLPKARLLLQGAGMPAVALLVTGGAVLQKILPTLQRRWSSRSEQQQQYDDDDYDDNAREEDYYDEYEADLVSDILSQSQHLPSENDFFEDDHLSEHESSEQDLDLLSEGDGPETSSLKQTTRDGRRVAQGSRRRRRKKRRRRAPTSNRVPANRAADADILIDQESTSAVEAATAAAASLKFQWPKFRNPLPYRGSSGERVPSKRELVAQVQELQNRCSVVGSEKNTMETTYEQASCQLQESMAELSRAKQTTQYLQSQLRDNEEMLQRVVATERRKAKEELVKMKEAMVKVVEREREAMRDEFMKQAAELQSMWEEQQDLDEIALQ